MTTTPTPEQIAEWQREADTLITVLPPQGVNGSGAALVLVQGNPVARYSRWAALATVESIVRDAEDYAGILRQRYVNLATGNPFFGQRVPRKCSLTYCDEPYHATYTEGDSTPLDLCIDHFDQVAR